MGFLDKEQKLREVLLAEEQAKRKEYDAAMDTQKVAQLALQKQREEEQEDRSHGPEDNAKIAELLENLPKFNISEYLGLVEKHSGYSVNVTLYTRDVGLSKGDLELKRKLVELGIEPFSGNTSYFRTNHPREMFCGEEVQPKRLFSISEPQEPGIGIAFSKYIKERRTGPNSGSEYTGQGFRYSYPVERVYHNVFVRLLPPATVFTTGAGETKSVTSMKILDDAFMEAFRHHHTKRVPGTGIDLHPFPHLEFG